MRYLFLLLIFGCSSSSADRSSPISKSELAVYQDCSIDSDCTISNNGCCDCANGGEDVAIAKTSEEEFKLNFSCENVACTMLGRDPPCGSGKAICVSGKCEIR